jgi:chaperonin GroEL (HSP60 family)
MHVLFCNPLSFLYERLILPSTRQVPGGTVEECSVLDGIMLNKDITHPKMRRRIENPRIVLLDCPLEYKKGEVGMPFIIFTDAN